MLTKLVVIQTILLIFQIILYFGSEYFQKNFHDVKRPIDDKIPFIEWSCIPYSFWFPLIALYPICLYYGDSNMYVTYMTTMFLEIVISVIIYLIYPTTFKRPVPSDKLSGKLMAIIFKGSYRGVNCAPSLHCSSCYLIIYTALLSMHNMVGYVSIVVAVMIVLSTMTTKQHTVIDVVSAFPLFVLCLLLGKLIPFNFLLAV